MSCWPAGESLAAEAAWPFPPAPLPELAPAAELAMPLAAGALAGEASAGAASAPLAAVLPEPPLVQPASAVVAISASPAGSATRRRVVRMSLGRRPAHRRLRPQVTIGHRAS